MRTVFLSLVLTAVHVSVDCRPRPGSGSRPGRLEDPQEPDSDLDLEPGSSTGAGAGHRRILGSLTAADHRGILVFLPVKHQRSNFVSIFDLRRKRFVCVNSEEKLYVSRHRNRVDCLFDANVVVGRKRRRQRRSEEVNPSDPLRSHSHPSPQHPATDQNHNHNQDQDRSGAESKETITSCDDPLKVLQPNGLGQGVSPVKTNIADAASLD